MESHRSKNRQANGAMGGKPRSEGRGEKDRETRETRNEGVVEEKGWLAGWLLATRDSHETQQPARQTTHPRQDCFCNEGDMV